MAREFATLEPDLAAEWFATADPADTRLGSGGGTAHLLRAAWQSTGKGQSFADWLRSSRKLMIHGGGQSRRLPAYAAMGKPLIPLPVMRWSLGQRLRQTLLEAQAPLYRRLLNHAPAKTVAMVTNGDVLLRGAAQLPALPDVDVLAIGLWVRAEQAQHHGVFFCPRQQPDRLAFFLQKPSPATINELAGQHVFLIDTGVWLLSERAVNVLLRKSEAGSYELYAGMGLGLGATPTERDPEVNALTSAVVPLPEGAFYHFGTSRDLIQSVSALQNLVTDQTKLGLVAAKPHPDQHTQNSTVHATLRADNHGLWIENSSIPASWQLSSNHILTGVPENDWHLKLDPGVSLDFVPVGNNRVCVRFYGMDDPWLAARGRQVTGDLQHTPLFPVLRRDQLNGQFIQQLITGNTPAVAERFSAHELAETTDLAALYAQREANRQKVLLPLAEHHERSVFYRLDLDATADLYAATPRALPAVLPADTEPLKLIRDRMFRAVVQQRRGAGDWQRYETEAFGLLRDLILRQMELAPVRPVRRVLDDQIIWGRSPVRLDLAGGWTDTPPYCLQFGGQVVNVAVNLNGQPPIQVFARLTERPELVIRSIDLGLEERVRSFEELAGFENVASGFSIAKAAFALAGFLPRFLEGTKFPTLAAQLQEFGGGIEIALLSAVPKGSGLGTSSILAATLLGTLSDLCGLNWSRENLFARTLALEQMLSAGGGWQDQIGGVLRGLKLIETAPGLDQKPTLRWLPDDFFGREYADQTVLLYYTGLTRVAKGILKEIVRGMFLNAHARLEILAATGQNAAFCADAIQRHDWNLFAESIRRTWTLKQQLDNGTNPPAVQAILQPVADYLAAAKLPGAGGGGYLLMLAKDDDAARRIRQVLTANPPNPKARFVSLSLSAIGFEVTRS
jgi:galactokinase/mevalonate kinase-like predicted kinase